MKTTTIIASGVVVIAAGALGGLRYVGAQAKDNYLETLKLVEQSGVLEAEMVSYEDGFLNSTAMTRIRLAPGYLATMVPPEEAEQAEMADFHAALRDGTLQFRHVIDHVPRLGGGDRQGVKITTTLVPTSGQQKWIDLLGIEQPLRGETYVALDGDMYSTAEFPAWSLKRDKGVFDWHGMTSRAHITADTLHMIGRADSDGLRFAGEQAAIEFDGFSAEFDGYHMHGLWIGDQRVRVAPIRVQPPGGAGTAVAIEAIALDSHTEADGPMLQGTGSLEAGSMNVSGLTFPALEMRMEFDNLHAEALRRYTDGIRELQADVVAGKVEPAAFPQEILPLIEGILRHSPGMHFNELRFATPWGEFLGDMALAYQHDPSREAAIAQNPALYLNNLHFDGSFHLDRELLEFVLLQTAVKQLTALNRQQGGEASPEDIVAQARTQADARLSNLVSNAVLVADGGQYRTEIELKGGGLHVNGVDRSQLLAVLLQPSEGAP